MIAFVYFHNKRIQRKEANKVAIVIKQTELKEKEEKENKVKEVSFSFFFFNI